LQQRGRVVKEVSGDPQESGKSSHGSDSYGEEQKSVIDYKSGNVNISQILSDFKNTVVAIGAPQELEQEVYDYLNLAKIQSQKASPSRGIIRTNLKNAAEILDDYITKTLNKDSKVVSNWIDALLLQKVDYEYKDRIKSQEKSINRQVANNFAPEQSEPAITEPDIVSEKPPEQKQFNPDITRLKVYIRKFEKLAEGDDFQRALLQGNKALNLAEKLGKEKAQAKIYLEFGNIYDTMADIPSALENYHNAAMIAAGAADFKTQASAHYNMGSIYDDLGLTDVAIGHYFKALGLDGELEGLGSQAQTLNDIGNIFSFEKNYKQALVYYGIGYGLAGEQKDTSGQACILNNTAEAFKELGYDKKALEFYRKSAGYDRESGNMYRLADTLEQAGDLMYRNGEDEKAERLYKRSLNLAKELDDTDQTVRIKDKLSNLAA